MALELKEFQVCPYANRCPHNEGYASNRCLGGDSTRKSQFRCDLVDDSGNIKGVNEAFRSSHDQTGKMKILVE